ncbi:MAG: SDR family NAD(P)-dependent oxidoreductase [Gaiellales bacterium]
MSTNGRPVAVVTGASSGIGEATARLLTARGWYCVLVARREDRLAAIAGELGCEWETCDVGDRDSVAALAARIGERHEAIHLLLNNAGMPARGTFVTVDLDLLERVTRVNYLGGVWCTRALLPLLEAGSRTRSAHVVNLVSVAGTVAFAPAGAYSASKHAQLAFSRSLAAATRGSGVKVHAVLPGFVETEGFPQKGVLRSRLLSRFVIEPQEVAAAILKTVERNRAEITVPWFPYRFVTILQALVPGLMARFAGVSDYRRDSV